MGEKEPHSYGVLGCKTSAEGMLGCAHGLQGPFMLCYFLCAQENLRLAVE